MKKVSKVILAAALFWASAAHAEPQIMLNSEAVRNKTISQSLRAKSVQIGLKVADENLKSAKSQYDTQLNSEISYVKDKSERSVPAFGTNTTQTLYSVSVSQLTPLGSQTQVGFQNTKNTTDSVFTTNPKLYDSRFFASIKQPLLKNSLGYNTRKALEWAKTLVSQAQDQTNADMQDLVLNHLQLYWNWQLHNKLTALNNEALSAAIRLYRTNRQKMVVGLREESDIYAFAANVDLKRSDWLQSQSGIDLYEGQLKARLGLMGVDLVPGKENKDKQSYSHVDSLVKQALSNNPMIKSMRLALKAQNINVAMQKNSKLPQLDLIGSLTLNGLDPTFSTSFSDISNGNPIWSGGVQLSLPLQNRAARANYKRNSLQAKQMLFGLKDLENEIISRVQQGYARYLKASKRLQVVASAVNNQKLKWEGEIKKYDQGRSDPDQVIRYQNDYLDTRKLYASTQIEYQMTKLELDYSLGNLVP